MLLQRVDRLLSGPWQYEVKWDGFRMQVFRHSGRITGALRSAQENRDMLFAEVNFSSALSQLDQAWYDDKTAKPFAVCPSCQGQLPDKCTLCKGRGLISEHRWNTCVTREDKEFRSKAKKSTTDEHGCFQRGAAEA